MKLQYAGVEYQLGTVHGIMYVIIHLPERNVLKRITDTEAVFGLIKSYLELGQ